MLSAFLLSIWMASSGVSLPMESTMADGTPTEINLDFMVREFSRDGQTSCLRDGYCYSVNKKTPIYWNDFVRVPSEMYRCTMEGDRLANCFRIDERESKYECGVLTCTCTPGWDCFKMNLDLAAWGPCHKNGDQVTCCISEEC